MLTIVIMECLLRPPQLKHVIITSFPLREEETMVITFDEEVEMLGS